MAGAPLTLGSDSHAVIDLFEEMRAVELDERLATQERGHWTAAELLAAATATGHASLGFGRRRRGSPSGSAPTWSRSTRPARGPPAPARDESTVVFAATAEDVVAGDGRRAHRRPAG